MSYILEALKKAEKQRDLGRVPGIHANHDTPVKSPQRHYWPWVIAALLVVNAAILTVMLWPDHKRPESVSDSSSTEAANSAPQSAPTAASSAAPPVQIAESKPVVKSNSAIEAEAADAAAVFMAPSSDLMEGSPSDNSLMEESPADSSLMEESPADSSLMEEPATDETPLDEPPVDSASTEEAPNYATPMDGSAGDYPPEPEVGAEAEPSTEAALEQTPAPTAPRKLIPLPLPAPSPSEAAANNQAAPATIANASTQSPPTAAPTQAPAQTSSPGAGEALPLWPLVPDSVYRKVNGRLELNVHVYSRNPDGRFVMLNMKRYGEGDKLFEGPTVEKITEQGVILSLDGERFRLNAQ